MEHKEYKQFMTAGKNGKSWGYFYSVVDTVFDSNTGLPLYHKCVLCNYTTRKIEDYEGVEGIDHIDTDIIKHVWSKHKDIVSKTFQKLRSEEIANQKGQMKLGEQL